MAGAGAADVLPLAPALSPRPALLPAAQASDWDLVDQARLSLAPRAGAVAGVRRPAAADAFSRLFERHASAVYSFLVRYTGDSALAEDLTQETFLAAFRNLDRLRPDGGGRAGGGRELTSLRPWLMRVARNLAVSHYRRPSSRERPGLAEGERAAGDHGAGEPAAGGPGPGESAAADPEEAAVRRERAEAVRRAVAALPPRYREPVLLFYAGDMTYAEIAAALGLPLGTVATRLRRALRLLARELRVSGI